MAGYRALYLDAKQQLAAAGVDAPGEEAMLLLSHYFRLDRPRLALRGEEEPSPSEETAFREALARRTARVPLQYILGEWEFMGLRLRVTDGVLCPREDTAVLVETAAHFLKNRPAPMGLDLCAGTGAVALGLCSLLEEASVTCIELSPPALSCLGENLAAFPRFSVSARQGDVLLPETAGAFPPASLDFILSNPPYIPSGELEGLQPEVRQEPALALDGGGDGLRFYRAICSLWAPLLKPGGLLAVEIGEEQAPAVRGLLEEAGFTDIRVKKDLAGLDRCVWGVRS